ncbi:MAG: ABC transporter permease [bacterium]|nr:ABC transporter permease [bacterium]
MRRIWHMVLKDLRRQVRSPMAMIVVLLFPIVFASLLGLTFGSGSPRAPKVELLVEDRDQSLLSGILTGSVGNEELAQYFDVSLVGADGAERIEAGEASALLRIPEGFQEELLAGRPVQLQLVRNPAQSIMPEIAEQATTVLADVLSAGARILADSLRPIAECLEGDSCELTQAHVMDLAGELWLTVDASEPLLLPPVIQLESVTLQAEGEVKQSGSVFLFVLPGISVWALFMLGDVAMRDILVESREGTLRRQLTCPVTTWQLVVAKALFTAVVAILSLLILTAVGAFAAESPISLAGFVVLSFAVILAVTGYSALVYGVARTERQGSTLSSILLLFFAFVGGSFIQVQALPAALQKAAPVSPFYWGTEGYRALIREAAGVADILPNAGVLSGLGIVLLFVGARLLGRNVSRGVAA